MEMMESAEPEMRLRLWVIEHFRVLPTDPRFKALDEDQMEVLFFHFINSGTDEQHRLAYHTKMSRKETIDTMPRNLMEDMGYTKEELEKITQELTIGGR